MLIKKYAEIVDLVSSDMILILTNGKRREIMFDADERGDFLVSMSLQSTMM